MIHEPGERVAFVMFRNQFSIRDLYELRPATVRHRSSKMCTMSGVSIVWRASVNRERISDAVCMIHHSNHDSLWTICKWNERCRHPDDCTEHRRSWWNQIYCRLTITLLPNAKCLANVTWQLFHLIFYHCHLILVLERRALWSTLKPSKVEHPVVDSSLAKNE